MGPKIELGSITAVTVSGTFTPGSTYRDTTARPARSSVTAPTPPTVTPRILTGELGSSPCPARPKSADSRVPFTPAAPRTASTRAAVTAVIRTSEIASRTGRGRTPRATAAHPVSGVLLPPPQNR